MFFNLPTSWLWKALLMFQCLPIIAADIVNNKPHGSSIVVIWPLRSLMEDQAQYSKSLANLGIPAIFMRNDENPEIILQVLNGHYILVFGLPEWFVVLNYTDSYSS